MTKKFTKQSSSCGNQLRLDEIIEDSFQGAPRGGERTPRRNIFREPLRFGDQRVMAILAALVGFCHVVGGFTNGQLVERTAALINASYTSRQATYDLRRLKRKGLIGKLAGTRRYQLTALGRRVAMLFTKTYCRVLAPGLSALDPRLPKDISARSSLATAWRAMERVLDDFIQAQLVAA